MEEYSTVENGIGFITLPHAVIRFQGTDCKKFLQGASSNDIKNLQKERGIDTCFLNPKGRLIAATQLFELEDGIWGITTSLEAKNLIESLTTQLLFSETELADLSDQYDWILGIGRKAHLFVSDFFNTSFDHESLTTHKTRLQETEIHLIQETRWIYPAFLLLISKNQSNDFFATIQEKTTDYPIGKISDETLNLLRIESKIPIFGIDMNEKTIPLEANLDSYISYTKGCYTGQETISRIKHYGHVNKILAKMQFETVEPISINTPISSGEKEIGKVTSSVYSPKLKNQIALGTIEYNSAKKGTNVMIRLSGTEVTGTIL